MIDNPTPLTWQDLQNNVNQILLEIGLQSEIGKLVETPRGSVEIDVYAVDVNSVDKIKYIVECKNWANTIPQSVVHSFTTVMHETGGNIGFIISQKGLQSGAKSYTKNTNIIGLTYLDFQKRYFNTWFQNYFCQKLGEFSDDLIQYTEPINSRRSRKLGELASERQQKFSELYEKYLHFGITLCMVGFPKIVKESVDINGTHISIEEFKNSFSKCGPEFMLTAKTFRGFLTELNVIVTSITDEFNNVFGNNIFA
jgi:hypothetical protein